MPAISLSLISHTNVGKTTLARTLLRRDVGEVRDAAHVTETAESFVLIDTLDGDELRLWDTPGFGDSARLLRRLRHSTNPLGWFLSRVWDRLVDRPFFSSQQAIRNVRDEADVVLYLVNASEDPAAAAWVDAEMQILEWIERPVLVLLNQLGAPRPAAAEAADVSRWATHLARYRHVRDTLAFDAFARCWVQEHVLLDRIGAVLPTARQPTFARLADAWKARNRAIFEQSMQALARQLAATAADSVALAGGGLADAARAWLGRLLRPGEKGDEATDAAMGELARRLDAEVRRATDELIELHGLSGRAAAEVLERMGAQLAVDKAADPTRASVLGAAAARCRRCARSRQRLQPRPRHGRDDGALVSGVPDGACHRGRTALPRSGTLRARPRRFRARRVSGALAGAGGRGRGAASGAARGPVVGCRTERTTGRAVRRPASQARVDHR